MTWGGVLQASVMTWGGVAKPPVMPRGLEVGPHPWDCLRGMLTAAQWHSLTHSQICARIVSIGRHDCIVVTALRSALLVRMRCYWFCAVLLISGRSGQLSPRSFVRCCCCHYPLIHFLNAVVLPPHDVILSSHSRDPGEARGAEVFRVTIHDPEATKVSRQ